MKIKIYTLILSLFVIISCEDTEQGLITSDYSGENDTEQYSNNEKYQDYIENPFINTDENPISTFSVDADGASYSNMRRFLYYGQTPPKASVRIEEYINYFTFDYAEPVNGESVGLNSEISSCPWNAEHYLMRVGMKGKTIPKSELPYSNYVFLIDVSGSMDVPEKLEILKSGFKLMVDEMLDQDRIAIVTYAGTAGVLLQSTYGDEKNKIKEAIDQLGAGGSTAGAQGIITAYEIAEDNFILGGNNRVILGSDGDFNVGPSSNEELVALIEEKRETGIFLTVLGVGTGNLNDYMMEQVADHGNGNYEYIDNVAQLKKVFIHDKAKFYTVAKDLKIQITFNPQKVESYRLIGYENRSLSTEDFDNDSVDAGEIGSGQTTTALYELIVHEESSSDKYAQFNFRYKNTNEDQSRILNHAVTSVPSDISNSSENMRFAASLAGFGLMMKQSEYKGEVTKQMVVNLGASSTGFDPYGYRKEFVSLVEDWNE